MWKSSSGSTNDYDIYVRYQMPSDYARDGSNQATLTVNTSAWRDTSSDSVTLAMYNAANNQCSTTTTLTTSDDTWVETSLGTLTSDADCNAIVANDIVVFVFHMTSSGSSAEALLGEIRLDYTSQ
jgi:hypothetical protein